MTGLRVLQGAAPVLRGAGDVPDRARGGDRPRGGPRDRRRRLCGEAVQPARSGGAGARHPQAQQRAAGGAAPRGAASSRWTSSGLQIHYLRQALKLTALEFRLLQQLAGAPERVLRARAAAGGVGMPPPMRATSAMSIPTSRRCAPSCARSRPAREPIQTHRGFGYSYQPACAAQAPDEALVADAAAVRRRQRAGGGGSGWFALRQVLDEVKPAVRQSTEETLVDTANLLAELVAARSACRHAGAG